MRLLPTGERGKDPGQLPARILLRQVRRIGKRFYENHPHLYRAGSQIAGGLIQGLLALSLLAPAPLPRRDRGGPPLLPPRCVMRWAGHSYQTEFRRDGSYQATAQSGAVWRGSWRVEGLILVIRETTIRQPQQSDWLEWRAVMRPGLREGRLGEGQGGEVRLEVAD